MSQAEKRVLFVAFYFPPRGGAGVQRSAKFVKYLRRFGWEPTVLTTPYPRRSPSYDESLLGELPEGTRIVEVPSRESLFIRLADMGLGRLAGFFLRPDAMVTWAAKAFALAREMHRRRPFDVAYTSVQPWSAGLVGLRLKSGCGLPWVSDFRDPWTESLHLEWPSRLHWLLDRRTEGKFLRAADRTLVVTPTMKEEFLSAHPGLSAERVKVVYNGFDEEDFSEPAAADDGKFTVVFTGRFQYDHRAEPGGIGLRERIRGLATYRRRRVRLETHSPVFFLRALAEFFERFPTRRARVRVVLAGTVGAGNLALVEESGLGEVVECPGYLPHRESVALARSADALLLPMFSTPDRRERVAYASGKVFEYMAARKPILVLAQEGDARDLAVRSGLGVAAAPEDVPGIVAALDELYRAWESGRPAGADEQFISLFTRENTARELAATFDEVLEESGRRA